MSETSDKTSTPSPHSGGVRSALSGDVNPRTFLIVLFVGVLAFLAFTRGGTWLDAMQRRSIVRRDIAPTELHGMRLGMSRMEVAKMFADSGVEWGSITKPGMMPTPWAAQQHVSINGFRTVQMSVRFVDGVCWDYGAITTGLNGVIDPKKLIGPMDSNSALNGIMWNFENKRAVDADEIARRKVPLKVLNLLGSWHSEDQEITGFGLVYKWEWPDVAAYFRTVDGSLQFQSRGDAASAPVASSQAGPSVPIGAVSGAVEPDDKGQE